MNGELRILILEDQPTDAELMETELRDAGLAFVSRRADNRDAFMRALDEFDPGLVLADYKLPAFNGLDALAIVRARRPFLPYVFVTGSMGEDRAVETLKQGATDYVIKDRLFRLPPVVRRALEDEARRAQQHEADRALRLSARVFECSAEAIVITDRNNDIVSVNRAFTAMTGYSAEEVRGRNPRLLASGRHDRDFYRNLWAAVRQAGLWTGELWNRRKDGEVFPLLASISVLRDEAGEILNHFAVFSDISRSKALEASVERLSQYDALTDLPNRRLLNQRLASAIAAAEDSRTRLAVLSISIDHFRAVNEGFGFLAGDAVLVEAARRLGAAMPAQGVLSRLERDSFVAVLAPVEGEGDAAHAADAMLEAIALPMPVAGQEFKLTSSIGVSLFPRDGGNAQALLANADAALDRARAQGRNTCRFFDPDTNERTHDLLILESALHRALERDELRIHYQPQVHLASRTVAGTEALLRWQRPAGSLLRPDRFVPIAEQTGLIISIGEWVLREACRQTRAWQAAGFPQLRVAVNVSVLQLVQPDFAERVRAVLADTGFDAALLELELTESLFMKADDATSANLKKLADLGIALSIDDFGTGYAGFRFLKIVPVSKIKIDQSFVRGVTNGSGDAAIIQAISAMGRGLGLQLIAEGVETESELGYVRSMECDEVQGHFFSPALPPEEVPPFLRDGVARRWAPEGLPKGPP